MHFGDGPRRCLTKPLMYVCGCRREEKLKEGLLAAISVPLKLASKANTLWPTLKELATVANIACKSDFQVSINHRL